MQSHQFEDPNLFMYTPSLDDNALFQIDPLLTSHHPLLMSLVEPVDQALSVNINNPCISITEATPSTLPESSMNDLWSTYLATQGNSTDWLSWTPMHGNSPASVTSKTFDEPSISPEPLYLPVMLENINSSYSTGYPSPSLSVQSEKTNKRPRRISEPPMSFQDQFQLEFYPPPPKETQVSRKRKRANSTHNHTCPHPGCGKHFTRPYNLTSHMRTHTADRPFACSQCGRKFARQHDRNRHEKLHWGIKPYACMHCNKPFARMDALNRHLRVDNGCQQEIQKKIQTQL